MASFFERLSFSPRRAFAVLALGGLLALPLSADIAVVTGESTAVDAIDEAQAKALWLGTVERIGGIKLSVVDRSGAEIREVFYRRVLNKTRGQVKAIRAKRAFQYGMAPPPELPSDDSVLRWVRARENRLGYVEATAAENLRDKSVEDPVKILLVIKVPKGSEQP